MRSIKFSKSILNMNLIYILSFVKLTISKLIINLLFTFNKNKLKVINNLDYDLIRD